MVSKYHDNLTIEYPIQTGCFGTVAMARRIFKVIMRPLSNIRVQIREKGESMGKNRKCQQNLIVVDFYAAQNQVEEAVKKHMLQKHHVQPENLTLKWEKGDLFNVGET